MASFDMIGISDHLWTESPEMSLLTVLQHCLDGDPPLDARPLLEGLCGKRILDTSDGTARFGLGAILLASICFRTLLYF